MRVCIYIAIYRLVLGQRYARSRQVACARSLPPQASVEWHTSAVDEEDKLPTTWMMMVKNHYVHFFFRGGVATRVVEYDAPRSMGE